MTISVGSRVPDIMIKRMGTSGPEGIKTNDIFTGEKVILFGVPGAFTPTCSQKHLPGFVNYADDIKAKGVTTIACMSVNDAYVMDAWGKSYSLKNELILLADVKGDFTKSIGAEFNWRGWSMRSMRYTMLLHAGVVKKLVEEEGKCELTAAENFLKDI